MAKEFDIYLKHYLTMCDLIVYSIPYHEGLTVKSALILEAALNGYILQKFAAAQMGIELGAHIDEMMKLCKEKLGIYTELDASVKIESHDLIYPQNDPIILNNNDVKLLASALIEAESGIIMAVEPLRTQMAKSTGIANFPMIADAVVTDTFKRDLLSVALPVIPNAEVLQVNQLDYISADPSMILDAKLPDIFYRLTSGASCAVMLEAIVLGTEIRHSLGRWYPGLTVDAEVTMISAQKFEMAESILTMLQEVTGTLVKVLYPEDDAMYLAVSELNMGLKRYRLLYEVDDKMLSEMDDMTLDELDYVWLIDV